MKLEFNTVEIGKRACHMFDNGYGVSVVSSMHSYGGKEGLYELAVLNEDGTLNYSTEITNDVVGHLTLEDRKSVV